MKHLVILPVLLFCAFAAGCSRQSEPPQIPAQSNRTAELIFSNECGEQLSCLTSWNHGEEFASLGIGHFIWYPVGTTSENKHFLESFPQLLDYLTTRGVTLPAWLAKAHGCPWPDRQAFIAAQNEATMNELRQLLQQTMPLQAAFMQERAAAAFPKVLAASPDFAREHLLQQYERVRLSPMGNYVLTDYVNFKGEGTAPVERYQGRGWGLLQVLAEMQGESIGVEAIQEFARAADVVLTRRVQLSPAERDEKRWLAGWRKRLATYPAEAAKASMPAA
ncbi:MAG TPA: hypothetical protein VNI58_07360 [Mariprofundaceae bacterium]|nr:hypothetical protein [Mariprofundaceae bacterium]